MADTVFTQPMTIAGQVSNVGMEATDSAGAELANAWGLSYALLNDPVYGSELKEVLRLLNAKNYTAARQALENSKFFKNNGATVASRIKLKASQPGAYADSLNKYKEAQKRRLVSAGIKVDATKLDAMLTKAYDTGLDENQLDNMILGTNDFSAKFGGTTLGSVESLKQYASAFGMSYNQTFWDSYSKDLFAGTTTVEDIQAKIRQDSASAYPVYAEAINEGKSLDAMMSAYKTSIANILEVDPDSITFQDKNLRRAAQYVDTNGKPALMPIWQFEKELRTDPRWEYTNNARDTIDSLSLKVLRDWGFA